MGIYRDHLSAIVIGDNFLPIIVIAQNSFDLSITDIAFVLYFVIVDKLSRKTIIHAHSVKLATWRYGKIHGVRKILLQFNKISFCLMPRQESVSCSLFLKNVEKHFCNLTYKKKTLSNSSKIYRNIYRKNLSAIIYRLPKSL